MSGPRYQGMHAKQDTDRYHLVATMVGGAAQSTTKWAASSVKNLNRNGISLGKGGDVDGFIVSSTSISRYLKLSQQINFCTHSLTCLQ